MDARSENVEECRRRCPAVSGVVADVESFDLSALGRFDIVHCFGLLYHLENPIAALRNMYRVCNGVLLLETMVLDTVRPVLALEDEYNAMNQALRGLGCRPSATFVTMALNRIGFRHVYGLAAPPEHEDFRFDWNDDGAWQRDGHPLRCIFVASSTQLHQSALIELTE
jgi:SAM-dependent methyltransferase